MRALHCLALLLTLIAPTAFADGLYQVELILFRQAGEPIPASQTAPDDWAADAQALAAGSERGTALNAEAAKLTAANGYQVLLHQAWQQNVGEAPTKIALSSGQQQFGHFPVEGTLSLKQMRFVDLESDFWINQFDADGLLSGSERLKQGTRLKTGELTFLDHGSLGLLIKVSPL
ncbi:CsiV family protein [Pseudomonas sp. 2FE]|uniref:CsiV family protein n=1 Tax=Pseudomonas sp. 2FE TaxID=2502190 RepID=UPI0010F85482|nr:CsiV family protein [Pseudomonas sp. 2FE]